MCRSWNSLMSIRIIRSSLPNSASASARASSVLPTPVGPRNRKLPMGRFGSPSPARERRTASAIAVTASSWPMTRWCRLLLELEQPFLLLLGELRDRDAGRAGDDLGDVGRADLGHVLLAGLVAVPVAAALSTRSVSSAISSRSEPARS